MLNPRQKFIESDVAVNLRPTSPEIDLIPLTDEEILLVGGGEAVVNRI